MKILAVSGSANADSSNVLLLNAVKSHFSSDHKIEVYPHLREFPLFRPEDTEGEPSELIADFRKKIKSSDAVIFCTPEYSHNIPAVLKNALEWITASGELAQKRVLAVTFTPHEPRGEHAMKSLIFTLKTLKANIVTQLPLYKSEITVQKDKIILSDEYQMFFEEALKLLSE